MHAVAGCRNKNKHQRLTALVSVATADVTNIMQKVTTVSMTKAFAAVSDGVVVPRLVIGCNSSRRTKEATMAPEI